MFPVVAENDDTEYLADLLSDLDSLYDSLDFDLLNPEGDPECPITSEKSLQSRVLKKNSRRSKVSTRIVPYSTGLQRRRKAELDELREEERKLSDQLELLLPVHGHTRRKQVVAPNEVQHEQWRSQAMTKCEERVQAERQNRQLKAIFIRHVKLFESVRKVLADDDTIEGVEFVVQPRLAIDRPLFHIDTTEAILGELSSNLSRMYLETCMVMAPLSSDPSVGSCFQTKLRGGYEMTIETTSYTPLVCNVTDAGKLLWLHVTDESNGDTFDFNSVQATYSDVFYARNYVTSLFIRDKDLDSPLYVIALATYQKYEAENQVVLVGSVRWLVPAERLEFEDQYWTIIEPSPIDSGHSSVVRTLYRLRSKDAEGGFTLQQQATRGTLIKSISNITRRYLQSMQNAFLDSTMLC